MNYQIYFANLVNWFIYPFDSFGARIWIDVILIDIELCLFKNRVYDNDISTYAGHFMHYPKSIIS